MDNGTLLGSIRRAGQQAAQRDAARRRDLAYQRTGMHIPLISLPVQHHAPARHPAHRAPAPAAPPVYQAPAAPVYHAPSYQPSYEAPAVAAPVAPPVAAPPKPPPVPLIVRQAQAAGTEVGQETSPALQQAIARFTRTHAWARNPERTQQARIAAAYLLKQGSGFYQAPTVTAYGRNLEPTAAPPAPPRRKRRPARVTGGEVG